MEARQGTYFDDVNRLCPTTSTFYAGTKSPRKNTKKTQNRPIRERPCVFCKEIHAPTYCTKVCDPKERVSIVKRNKLCYNCLGQHYFSECKSNSTCRNCNKKHHSSLCNGLTRTFSETSKHENTKEKRRNENIEEPTSVKLNVVNENEKNETTIFYSTQKRSNVLLKTAVSPVWSGNNYTESNILFDEGAQRSFVTETLAKNLNLKVDGVETLQISAFGKDSTSARELRKATIYIETENKRRIPIEVLVVPTIAVPLQNHIRHVNRNMDYLRGLRLAHPVSEENTFEIAVLIGADYYWDFIGDEIIRGNGPTAVKSKLGYLLSGPLRSGNTKPTDNSIMLNVLLSHKAEQFDLQKFWKLESLGIDSRENDDKEMEYVKEYQNSSIEFYGDRYYAKLPWKPDCDELPSNYYVTKRRTENVIRRVSKDPNMLKKYGEILQEQERSGFIEKVTETETTDNRVHLISYHPVFKKDSSTTPMRIVYDCSCKASADQPSLNDCLMNTPPALNDLSQILVRFRLHPVAITTDIEKAFLHVGLSEEDRDVTRFLWLSDPLDENSPLMTYRFKAVLFGATCSPFILYATLSKHLQLSESKTAKLLERNLYVDNILTSAPSEEDALTYFKEARALMSKASFNLRSWTSNSEKVRDLAENEHVLDTDKYTKVLGMRWNSKTDELFYPQKNGTPTELITKREILRY